MEMRIVKLKSCNDDVVALVEAYCQERLCICQALGGSGWVVLHESTGSTLTVTRSPESAFRAMRELLNLGDAMDVDLWDYNYICEFPRLTHKEGRILTGVLRKYFLQ